MSKPITAAAAMILVEECKLRLDEPVDRMLPELANRKVLKRLDGPLDDIGRAVGCVSHSEGVERAGSWDGAANPPV